MDEYRDVIKNAGAASIDDILADFAREEGNVKFRNNQAITVAGVIESVRTRLTRNNMQMAYIALEDGFGVIEHYNQSFSYVGICETNIDIKSAPQYLCQKLYQ
jgi:DNA polymerase III alpha subunit